MRVAIKIILTFVALIVATPIFALTQDNSILNLALLAGLVSGVVAIWKYNPDKNNVQGNVDKHHLDKTN